MPGGTILIADDDTAIRTVLNQALARAGYAPRATGNAATLWRWVSQGEGDVVITDVVMPDENAFDLIPRIKKLRPNLPVIVMSAQNTLMTALSAGVALLPLMIDPAAPGKEILHPVAITIFGGLISATLLDTFLTPVLFLRFGRKPLERLLAASKAPATGPATAPVAEAY